MRTLILLLFLTMVSSSQTPPIEPGVSQELARWRAAHYSDVRYKLSLTLEKMSPVLKGTMEIRVNVRDAGRLVDWSAFAGRGDAAIVLDWRKIKGHEDKSTVAKVSINGGETLFEESNEHLIFREGVIAGENVIKLDFTSPILPSGSAITRYIDKEDGSEYIYSLFVPSDASTAFPVFDQPDLKATFDVGVQAPESWKVISNGLADSPVGRGRSIGEKYALCPTGNCPPGFVPPEHTHHQSFRTTKPISTYVFAFAAGPFSFVRERNDEDMVNEIIDERKGTSKDRQRTGIGIEEHEVRVRNSQIWVRKSQAEKLKPHVGEVFRLNREGIKFLEEYFNYKFPFPKYDLVLIPEFPFGGMEHAGATFLRESAVIFPSEPTKNDHISRANLIFHEAAHQWFGDTVTMRWFDDLWLKEGFAEFMAYKTLERVMPQYNAWKAFYERNKQSAYLTDSTKGTTAIYQEIKNLSAAKSAYGNIVYRKAPSFLKQAEFYIGADKFQTAVRAFLKKHEFANAGWQDLVWEFEIVTKWKLQDWAQQWVKTPGLTHIFNRPYRAVATVLSSDGGSRDEYAYGFMFDQRDPGYWPMKTRALFIYRNGTRNASEVDFQDRTGNPGFAKSSDVSFAFGNYEDHGYAIFLLDDKSREYVLKNVQTEKDEFLRSMMWGSLWDSVREGELDPKEYVELVIMSIPLENDETTTQAILGRASTAMTYYITDKDRDSIAPRLEAILIEKMRSAPTLGQRITYYRALLNVASTENARDVLKKLLRQKSEPGAVATGSPRSVEATKGNPVATPSGRGSDSRTAIPLKTKDRFDIVTRLASLNDPDAEKLLADLEKTETSDDAKRYAYAARAAFPTKETKDKYWNDFVNNKQISESWIEAAFGPFNSVRHADLTLPYLERALNELPNHKRNRKIFFVNGWLAAFIGGQKSEHALAIVNKFLADNPNLDRDLRLKILENVDIIERSVKIRSKYP